MRRHWLLSPRNLSGRPDRRAGRQVEFAPPVKTTETQPMTVKLMKKEYLKSGDITKIYKIGQIRLACKKLYLQMAGNSTNTIQAINPQSSFDITENMCLVPALVAALFVIYCTSRRAHKLYRRTRRPPPETHSAAVASMVSRKPCFSRSMKKLTSLPLETGLYEFEPTAACFNDTHI